MKTGLLLSLLLSLLIPLQTPVLTNSPLTVTSYKWTRERRTRAPRTVAPGDVQGTLGDGNG